jgi:Protein of unknown function (DUF2510)
MDGESPNPRVPAGWYPDPSQAATQRYWDGSTWTDHRAPLATPPVQPPPTRTFEISPRLALGLLGAIAAAVGTFLPHAESASLLHIARNTLISTGDGLIVIVLALGGGAAAVRDATKPSISWPLIVIGVVLAGFGYLEAQPEQLKLVNGLGQEVEATAGPGVWAVGIGGGLIALAGLMRGGNSTPDSDSNLPSG